MAMEERRVTFVDCLEECDSVLSLFDRCYLSYLFGALLTANELRGQNGLVSVYKRLKDKFGPERSQSYLLYVLNEYANCYNEREKLAYSCQVGMQPPYDQPTRFVFRMREGIVSMDRQLTPEEFTKLVEHILAKDVIKSNADNFPASDPAKRLEFYIQLEKQQFITCENYQKLSKEMERIGRKDLSNHLLEGV